MYGLTPFAPLIGMLGVRVGELAGAGELELAASCVTGTCVLNQTNNKLCHDIMARCGLKKGIVRLLSRGWQSVQMQESIIGAK
jgi:hypothetical protein